MTSTIRLNKVVLTDAGFWISVAEQEDAALVHAENISRFHVAAPWPVIYEAARTKMARSHERTRRLERALERLVTVRIADDAFRDEALIEMFRSVKNGRPLSLVDVILRTIMQRRVHPFAALLTNNPNDFRDVCEARRIELTDVRYR